MAKRTLWVTKSEMSSFVRCPYAFWLVDQGMISVEQTVNDHQRSLMAAGLEFHELVEASAAPLQVAPLDLRGLLREESLVLLGTPDFKNTTLKLRGRPDGIDVAGGALYPIEIKSHKSVQRLDQLELAFYWLLLAPYRTVETEPQGRLVLRVNGQPLVVDVEIAPHRIAEVRALVEQVRETRRNGVRPRVCRCHVCRAVAHEEVSGATARARDLTMIFGIGRPYASALEAAGITSWDRLRTCDPAEVTDVLRGAGFHPSPAEPRRWRGHAYSLARREPVVLTEGSARPAFPIGDSFIAIDLEYSDHIWLAGVCIVTPDSSTYSALWADTPADEHAVLSDLFDLVGEHPDLPIITWAGDMADIPRLRNAEHDERFDSFLDRHVDLYRFARDTIRWPTTALTLKDLTEYLAIARMSGVQDGFQAQHLFMQYSITGDAAIKGQLLDYNRDDVDGLVQLVQHMRLVISDAASSNEQLPLDLG